MAADLGYVKDPLASSLRRAGTSTIGVVVPRLTDVVMAIVYEEIAAVATARGLFSVVATAHDEPKDEATAVTSLVRRRVDGIIRTTARLDAPLPVGLLGSVREVLTLRANGQLSASVGDDDLGGRLATRHLIDLGHRRIALVNGPTYASSARGRRTGYVAALAAAGIALDPDLVIGESFSIEAGAAAARTLLSRPNPPTAVFATNDNLAIGVWSVATAMGLRVPQDLSIVGYNDIPLARLLPVPLTTVRVPFGQIAAGAVELLLAESDPSPRTLTFAPTLIPRSSTGPAAK